MGGAFQAPPIFYVSNVIQRIFKMERPTKYTCTEYRQEMLLLALQRRISQEKLTEAERRELEENIRKLEAEMDMD